MNKSITKKRIGLHEYDMRMAQKKTNDDKDSESEQLENILEEKSNINSYFPIDYDTEEIYGITLSKPVRQNIDIELEKEIKRCFIKNSIFDGINSPHISPRLPNKSFSLSQKYMEMKNKKFYEFKK
ncbi:hypothetical protein BCR32DRAFT_281568 [Anaeromyces robustus]|uniref:Uncharacterized protein n=1 Tax=Anaeromyces robustus TaxID=1754192 RepID=A0A1Y1X0G5_9FUNG|nr:hypothetical protein BCR32DRAFT_281568 [Anaeromyces robustus]|eukprot:ORX79233.1 hypothetical protein BCR32DRAFT_281568 [Anaeromyces robustus]